MADCRDIEEAAVPATVGIVENASELKRRIAMIAKFKKVSKKWSVAGILAVAVVGCVALAICTSSLRGNVGSAEQDGVTGLGYVGWSTDCDVAAVEEPGETEDATRSHGGEHQVLGWGSYRTEEPKESD